MVVIKLALNSVDACGGLAGPELTVPPAQQRGYPSGRSLCNSSILDAAAGSFSAMVALGKGAIV